MTRITGANALALPAQDDLINTSSPSPPCSPLPLATILWSPVSPLVPPSHRPGLLITPSAPLLPPDGRHSCWPTRALDPSARPTSP